MGTKPPIVQWLQMSFKGQQASRATQAPETADCSFGSRCFLKAFALT
jgi:hypothetical protein